MRNIGQSMRVTTLEPIVTNSNCELPPKPVDDLRLMGVEVVPPRFSRARELRDASMLSHRGSKSLAPHQIDNAAGFQAGM